MPEEVQTSIGVLHPNLILEALYKLRKEGGFELRSVPRKLNPKNEWESIFCHIDMIDMEAEFSLQQMPGCCAVLVVSYVRVSLPTQANFIRVLEIVEVAAKNAGFGSVVMTQVVPAFNWFPCLGHGWICSKPFRNAKSGNMVIYLTKDLQQEGKKQGFEFRVHREQSIQD